MILDHVNGLSGDCERYVVVADAEISNGGEVMDEEIYGFGPREGALVNAIYSGFIEFARTHDISFAEMHGLISICQKLMIDDMVVRYDNESDHLSEEDWQNPDIE